MPGILFGNPTSEAYCPLCSFSKKLKQMNKLMNNNNEKNLVTFCSCDLGEIFLFDLSTCDITAPQILNVKGENDTSSSFSFNLTFIYWFVFKKHKSVLVYHILCLPWGDFFSPVSGDPANGSWLVWASLIPALNTCLWPKLTLPLQGILLAVWVSFRPYYLCFNTYTHTIQTCIFCF